MITDVNRNPYRSVFPARIGLYDDDEIQDFIFARTKNIEQSRTISVKNDGKVHSFPGVNGMNRIITEGGAPRIFDMYSILGKSNKHFTGNDLKFSHENYRADYFFVGDHIRYKYKKFQTVFSETFPSHMFFGMGAPGIRIDGMFTINKTTPLVNPEDPDSEDPFLNAFQHFILMTTSLVDDAGAKKGNTVMTNILHSSVWSWEGTPKIFEYSTNSSVLRSSQNVIRKFRDSVLLTIQYCIAPFNSCDYVPGRPDTVNNNLYYEWLKTREEEVYTNFNVVFDQF